MRFQSIVTWVFFQIGIVRFVQRNVHIIIIIVKIPRAKSVQSTMQLAHTDRIQITYAI